MDDKLPYKDCTACGSTDSDPANPLLLYTYARTGVAMGWVHAHCRDLWARGTEAIGMPPELFDFRWPN